MSAWTVKCDRKREIGQSPIKKRFKNSTISREDLDDAIANGIKLALKEQQSTLDSVVASAVRDAVDSVLTPALRELRADIQATKNSVKELRAELEAIATACCGQMRPKSSSLASTQLTVFGGGGMLPMTPRTPSHRQTWRWKHYALGVFFC